MAGSAFTEAYEKLTATLTDARRDAGLTQAEVAAKIGKPQSYVSKYESGERRLDVVEFCEIARSLGRKPTEILDQFLARG